MSPGIIVAGGSTGAKEKGCLSSCEYLQLQFDSDTVIITSQTISDLCTPRRGAIMTSLFSGSNQFLVCAGGCKNSTQHLSSLEYISCKTLNDVIPKKSWIPQQFDPNFAPEHSCASFVTHENSVTVFGGWNGVECLKQVHKISFNSEKFTSEMLKPLLDPLKNSFAIYDKKLDKNAAFLFGGWDGKRTLKTVFKYDLVTQEQTLFSVLPESVECHCCAFDPWSGAIFTSGGFDGVKVQSTLLRSILSPDGRMQHQKLDISLQDARECHGSAILEGNLVVFGGWNGVKSLDNIEVFRLLADSPFVRKLKVTGQLNTPRNRPAYFIA